MTTEGAQQTADAPRRVVLPIEGMTCAACVSSVTYRAPTCGRRGGRRREPRHGDRQHHLRAGWRAHRRNVEGRGLDRLPRRIGEGGPHRPRSQRPLLREERRDPHRPDRRRTHRERQPRVGADRRDTRLRRGAVRHIASGRGGRRLRSRRCHRHGRPGRRGRAPRAPIRAPQPAQPGSVQHRQRSSHHGHHAHPRASSARSAPCGPTSPRSSLRPPCNSGRRARYTPAHGARSFIARRT